MDLPYSSDFDAVLWCTMGHIMAPLQSYEYTLSILSVIYLLGNIAFNLALLKTLVQIRLAMCNVHPQQLIRFYVAAIKWFKRRSLPLQKIVHETFIEVNFIIAVQKQD